MEVMYVNVRLVQYKILLETVALLIIAIVLVDVDSLTPAPVWNVILNALAVMLLRLLVSNIVLNVLIY